MTVMLCTLKLITIRTLMSLSITMRDLRPKSIWRPPDQYQYMLRVMTNLEKRDFIKEAREKSFVPVFRADVSFFAGRI